MGGMEEGREQACSPVRRNPSRPEGFRGPVGLAGTEVPAGPEDTDGTAGQEDNEGLQDRRVKRALQDWSRSMTRGCRTERRRGNCNTGAGG